MHGQQNIKKRGSLDRISMKASFRMCHLCRLTWRALPAYLMYYYCVYCIDFPNGY